MLLLRSVCARKAPRFLHHPPAVDFVNERKERSITDDQSREEIALGQCQRNNEVTNKVAFVEVPAGGRHKGGEVAGPQALLKYGEAFNKIFLVDGHEPRPELRWKRERRNPFAFGQQRCRVGTPRLLAFAGLLIEVGAGVLHIIEPAPLNGRNPARNGLRHCPYDGMS